MTSLRRLVLALLAVALLAAPATGAAAQAPRIHLRGGTTTIVPDAAFAAAMQSSGLTATVLTPGATTAAGWTFPIVSGNLAGKRASAGEIRHYGGLRISAADGTHVDLNNPRVEDGRRRAVLTTQAGSGARITLATLDLDGATIRAARRRFVLSRAGLVLTDAAAEALDAQFATTAFSGGQRLGAATVSAKVRVT